MSTTSLAVLALISLVDSISYMAVSPSLIFYVLEQGGSKEQYGLIISIFSFASFATKPVYGFLVDQVHLKFRTIYIISFCLSISGAWIYFMASSVERVSMILIGRFLGGLGAANQALGYAYLALSMPQELQTRTNAILFMSRIVGMATGPGINSLLGEVDTSILGMPIDPLNIVGLLLAAMNALVALLTFLFLSEPPRKESKLSSLGTATSQSSPSLLYYLDIILSIEILLPLFIMFSAVAAFQLIETALPPVTSHSLGWGPVQASAVLGGSSIIVFGSMLFVMILSSKSVKDIVLIVIGNLLFIVGGTAIYLLWTDESHICHFVVPVMIAIAGFPFVGSPNRSSYTKTVKGKPELENSQAMMQALLSMAADVAGFITPTFVATFVIRTPEEVESSGDHRELTPLALYAPFFSTISLLGLCYKHFRKQKRTEQQQQEELAGEGTPLVGSSTRTRRRSSVVELEQEFSRRNEVARRSSAEMMGLCAFDTRDEKESREKMLLDLQLLDSLGELDFEEEGCACIEE